jgi:hypothetical protein
VIASITDHGRGEGADRRGPPAREGAVARGRAGVADGWRQGVRGGRGHAVMGRLGRGRERGVGARAREREAAWAGCGPAGGFPFLFFFLFLFLISIFYFFYLLFF